MSVRSNRATEDIVDAQNREYHDRLASKSSYLKSLAYEIETEARDHHNLLGGLDDDFDSATGFLGGTIIRVKLMMSTGRSNRKLMCYASLGVVFVLVLMYLVVRRLTSGTTD